MYPAGTVVDSTRAKYYTATNAMKNAGFTLSNSKADSFIIWIDGTISIEETEKLKHYQRSNKIPCLDYICFKSTLFEELNNLRSLYPNVMNFYPHTYMLPNNYPELLRRHSFICGRTSSTPTWVIKPRNGCCGRGIYLIQSSYEASNITESVVAQEMVDPYLLDGYKFDFRFYLLISSLEPYSAFLYKEGIARFCTEKYSPPTKANRDRTFMNLTNTSINVGSSKSPENFTKPASEVLNKIIKANPMASHLWESIKDVSRLLLASIYPAIIATLPNNEGKKFRHHISDPYGNEDWRPKTNSSKSRQLNPSLHLSLTPSKLQSKPPLSSARTSFSERKSPIRKSMSSTSKPSLNLQDSEINQPSESQSDQVNTSEPQSTNNPTEVNQSNSPQPQEKSLKDIVLLPSQHYFHLLGIDIILDTNLNPMLLELNDRPSIAVTVPFEEELKINLMREMFYHVCPDGSTLGDSPESGWQQIIPVDNPHSDIGNNVRKLMGTKSKIKYIGRVASNSPTTKRMVNSGINTNLHQERRKRAEQLRESSKERRFNNYLKASNV